MLKKRLHKFIFVILLFGILSSCCNAPSSDCNIKIINNSYNTLTEIYFTEQTSDGWGVKRNLGTISRSAHIVLTVKKDIYKLKIIINGDMEEVHNDIDLRNYENYELEIR